MIVISEVKIKFKNYTGGLAYIPEGHNQLYTNCSTAREPFWSFTFITTVQVVSADFKSSVWPNGVSNPIYQILLVCAQPTLPLHRLVIKYRYFFNLDNKNRSLT